MRYSQKYSREAGPNPSETSYSYEEFLDIVDVYIIFFLIFICNNSKVFILYK